MGELATAATILGAGLGVAKPAVETACRLIESLLGRPCKIAGGMIADEVYAWRWRNRITIAGRAQQIMAENGVAAKVLPRGFLLPLLDAAGNAEDPSLQEMWAQLLASSVSVPEGQHPSYVHVLTQLSPTDALVLRRIRAAPLGAFRGSDGQDQLAADLGLTDAVLRLSIGNIYRLGLLTRSQAHLSAYGAFFLAACGVSMGDKPRLAAGTE